MTLNFKVGDIVVLTRAGLDEFNYDSDDQVKAKIIQTGHRIGGGQWLNYKVLWLDGDDEGETDYLRSLWITKCTTCNNNNAGQTVEKSNSMGDFVSNAVSKVRQLAMSKDERLLRKYAIVDDCGAITQAGKELLIDLLFSANKTAVVSKLEEVEAEEKKSKK